MNENPQDSIEGDAVTEFQALAAAWGLELRDLWPATIRGMTSADALRQMIDVKEFDTTAIAAVFGIPTEYFDK